MLHKVVISFSVCQEIPKCDHSDKTGTEQYSPVVLLIMLYKVLESTDQEISAPPLKVEHACESDKPRMKTTKFPQNYCRSIYPSTGISIEKRGEICIFVCFSFFFSFSGLSTNWKLNYYGRKSDLVHKTGEPTKHSNVVASSTYIGKNVSSKTEHIHPTKSLCNTQRRMPDVQALGTNKCCTEM